LRNLARDARADRPTARVGLPGKDVLVAVAEAAASEDVTESSLALHRGDGLGANLAPVVGVRFRDGEVGDVGTDVAEDVAVAGLVEVDRGLARDLLQLAHHFVALAPGKARHVGHDHGGDPAGLDGGDQPRPLLQVLDVRAAHSVVSVNVPVVDRRQPEPGGECTSVRDLPGDRFGLFVAALNGALASVNSAGHGGRFIGWRTSFQEPWPESRSSVLGAGYRGSGPGRFQ
jgi:hypothetical protein